MGIQNKEGALYFATGIDNTGLYSGRQEAMGIIKAMASEITSFDVFSGIGISASIAFARAAKGAFDFEKQFQQSMKEVATLSSGIKGSLTDYMNQVMDITREVPILANDAAKALYQIVSAGHDGADGMKVLEVSAKAAIGGVTDTAMAADAITTILNAYKMDASKAQEVSDQLFTTVRLGKTDFGQLGKSIAQAAPIASSFGIDIREVLAAVASITKQGVPTSEAMTKIRAAILGTANQLGDAAFKGRTFQEALQLIYDKAGGSSTKMKELLGTDEALQAALMITGKNAQSAAKDLEDVGNSSGAAEAAFKEMASSAENQLKLLSNNITAYLRPLGESILKEISSVAQSMNDAFEDGSAQESLKEIGALIVAVTTALAGYKGSILAVSAAKQISVTVTAILNKQRSIEAANLVLSKGLYAIEATMMAKNMSARVLLTKAIKAQTIAQLKNAAAMLTNPYILAAAAFAGLGYAIYKVATAETTAERIQRKYNDSIAEAQRKADEEKTHLENLIAVLNDETSSNAKRLEVMNEIRDNYPSLFQKYIDEKGHVKDLIGLWKEYNETKSAEIVQQHKIDFEDINERIKNKLEEKQRGTDNPLVTPAAFNLKIEEELNALYMIKRQVEQRIEKDNFIQWQQDLKGRTEEQIQWELDEAKRLQDTIRKYPALKKQGVRITQGSYKTIINENQLKQRISILNSEQSIRGKSNNNLDTKTNESYWKNLKDDAVKSLKALSDVEASGKKGMELKKKIAEYDKKLESFSTNTSKQDDKAQKLREEQERYKILLDKQKRDQERMMEDSANELEQIEIDKLKESSEKVLRQRELNHKLELQAIDREAEDKKLKAIENARTAFEANPQNEKKIFNADEFVKSEPTKKLFSSFDNTAKEKKEAVNIKFNRGDDLAELLNEYQDYTDQRLAIERKFNEDIATLQEQRKQAEKDGNIEQIEQIDRAIAQATKNKGIELMTMDYDKLKESPEYVRAFENLKETSSETLNSLLDQLEKAKHTAAKVLSPDQLREYTTTIQEIMDELDSRNPFQALSDKKQELADAEQALADAQTALENARQQAESVKGGTKIENGISSKYNEKTGKIDTTKVYLTEAQALDKVKEKTDKYNIAKDNVVKKSAKVKKAEKEVKDQIDELFQSINEVGKAIGGPAGEIITLIGEIGSFTLMAMSGIKAAADTSVAAISAVEKASVILAIISTAIQIATKIFDLFGRDTTTEKYEKAKEAYESYINILDRVIDKQLELAESLSGKNANAAYQKAIDAIKEQSANARVLGQQYLNSGASRKSHSKGYEEVEDMSWEGWKQAADTLGMSVENFKNKMGGRMTGLFDLTDEQLAKLQENAGIFWSQLDSDTQNYADQIANGVAQVAEVIEQKITDTTLIDVDTLRSDFQDLLTDMDADSADFADNFEEYMRNAILNTMLKEDYMDKLKSWREKFYAAMDGGMTEEEYKNLKAEGQQLSDEMKARRDAMAEIYDWKDYDSSQDSSQKGFAAMSQDTGEELNGRFTALQIAGEEIKNQNIVQTGIQQIMSQRLEAIYNFNYSSMTEMRDIIFDIMDILSDMKKDTSHLYFIRESLNKIESNTKGLSNK